MNMLHSMSKETYSWPGWHQAVVYNNQENMSFESDLKWNLALLLICQVNLSQPQTVKWRGLKGLSQKILEMKLQSAIPSI